MGRLGLQASDLGGEESRVLADLGRFLDDQPSEAYAKLMHWQGLAIDRLAERQKPGSDERVRPRIDVTAEVNQKQNLTVRWFPSGWGTRFEQPTDFRSFQDTAWGAWGNRPPNELLWLKGVGELRPQPEMHVMAHGGVNLDVVHSILICAVRAAFERLIVNLERSCQVTVHQSFVFDEAEEADDIGRSARRVVGWHLANTTSSQIRPLQGA
jgi:hypothetical protein